MQSKAQINAEAAAQVAAAGDPLMRLQPLLAAVRQVQPAPLDAWEIAAILESLGYTDQLARAQWGAADIRELSRQVYQLENQLTSSAATSAMPSTALQRQDSQAPNSQSLTSPSRTQDPQLELPTTRANSINAATSATPVSALIASLNTRQIFPELQIFLQQFSRSLSYSFAWLLTTFTGFESTLFSAQPLTTEAAIILNLAVMLSLITTGGFIQIIVKQGYFYTAIAQPALAGNEVARLLRLLTLLTVLVSGALLLIGFYRHPFTDEYLIVGVMYYLLFSVLWGLASVLSLQQRPGQLVVVFGVFLLTLLAGNFLLINNLLSYLVALVVANVVAGLQTWPFWRPYRQQRANLPPVLPRRTAMIVTLAPYFIYGSGYFCFLFTDRIMAGLSVNESARWPFLINLSYQRPLDYALLALMLTAAVAEYGNDYLMRRWREIAQQWPLAAVAQRQTVLQQCYRRVIAGLITVFSALSAASAGLLYHQQATPHWGLFIAGIVGYGLFSYSLANALILFSLGKLPIVARALAKSLLINATVGYIAGQLGGPNYAVWGLVIGAIMFAQQTYQALTAVWATADYAFYRS